MFFANTQMHTMKNFNRKLASITVPHKITATDSVNITPQIYICLHLQRYHPSINIEIQQCGID
ncbi:hypothetical protein GCM10007086_12020 [Photobacterium aphoticum]|nr:hypothetical protein GCM10007086_12020 [Photobacterium aphoticum]